MSPTPRHAASDGLEILRWVVGIGLYYSINWHHDQNQKKKNDARAAQLVAAEHPLDAPDATAGVR
ncbi:hypothetical protein HGO37_22800 [Rhizobium sp. CG4]|uniref:hypothetical protein n=1 Tax=Rhizobium sp. CG4 TaxID=2726075 RepID=UPI00203486EC|nr:hypothetical protein [Rhizobium sp. CG4]MCM2458228.1 hypothetical protein [Rhizobium sp. CG4]